MLVLFLNSLSVLSFYTLRLHSISFCYTKIVAFNFISSKEAKENLLPRTRKDCKIKQVNCCSDFYVLNCAWGRCNRESVIFYLRIFIYTANLQQQVETKSIIISEVERDKHVTSNHEYKQNKTEKLWLSLITPNIYLQVQIIFMLKKTSRQRIAPR